MEKYLYKELTYKIIGCAIDVHKELGPGFLEKVYENAMLVALKEVDLSAENQKQINVKYHGITVGDYYADLIIEGKVIVELKAIKCLCDEHRAQIINYLTATEMQVGLLLNFGAKSLEYERFAN